MHVLQVLEPGKDGVFRHVEGLCDYLQGQGVALSLAYSDVRSSDQLHGLVKRVEAEGGFTVNLQTSNSPQMRDMRAFLRLQRLLRKARPDIVHAHSSKAGGLARLLRLCGHNVPVVYTPNAYSGMGLNPRFSANFFNLIERALAPAAHTINVSQDEAKFAFDKLRIRREKQSTIYNAIDLSHFYPPSPAVVREARLSFNLPPEAILIGCIARDSYQKNVQMLYRAVAIAARKHPNLWLFHLGKGDMEPLTRELGLESRLRRLDYLADTSSFYHAIDAFAMPSRYEGLSFAILEALASDLPLILTNVPGNREFLNLGLSHIWSVPDGDTEALANAIDAWVVDRANRPPSNHAAVAEKIFSYDACYSKVLKTYHRLTHTPYPAIRPIPAPVTSSHSALVRSSASVDFIPAPGPESYSPSQPASPRQSILIVVEPGLDGVFRHVEGLVDFLMQGDTRIHLAYSSRRSGAAMLQLVERVRAAGGETMDMGIANLPQPADVIAFVRLAGFIRRLKPDVVHAHSSKAGALARFMAMFVRGPRYLYTPHAYYGMGKPPSPKVRFFNWIEHLIGRIGTTIAISQDEADFARQVLGVPPDRIHVIHNPVDPTRFFPPSPAQRQAARTALGIPEKTVVLATIGRMCWQKDPETAYGGVAPVCAQNPDLLYLHLGWGKWKEYLLGLGQRLGLGSQLRILEYTDNPQTFYHALDGVLITSRYEAGWALVLLEALACNLPVAVSTSPGMSDIGRAGLSHLWTFPPGEKPACTAAVEQWLLAHREGRNSYNHRDFVMARLSPSRCYGAVAELYRNESSVSKVSPMANAEELKTEGLKD
jgi:glycosyltransferase involved in cell wall biosynthesis